MIGARQLVPYLRLFPIWHYGPIYSLLDGRYVRHGWKPDRFGVRERPSCRYCGRGPVVHEGRCQDCTSRVMRRFATEAL